jgi:hypothetical protein
MSNNARGVGRGGRAWGGRSRRLRDRRACLQFRNESVRRSGGSVAVCVSGATHAVCACRTAAGPTEIWPPDAPVASARGADQQHTAASPWVLLRDASPPTRASHCTRSSVNRRLLRGPSSPAGKQVKRQPHPRRGHAAALSANKR